MFHVRLVALFSRSWCVGVNVCCEGDHTRPDSHDTHCLVARCCHSFQMMCSKSKGRGIWATTLCSSSSGKEKTTNPSARLPYAPISTVQQPPTTPSYSKDGSKRFDLSSFSLNRCVPCCVSRLPTNENQRWNLLQVYIIIIIINSRTTYLSIRMLKLTRQSFSEWRWGVSLECGRLALCCRIRPPSRRTPSLGNSFTPNVRERFFFFFLDLPLFMKHVMATLTNNNKKLTACL